MPRKEPVPGRGRRKPTTPRIPRFTDTLEESPSGYGAAVSEQQLLEQLMELVQGAIALRDDPKVWAALLDLLKVWRRQRMVLDVLEARRKIEIKASGKSRMELDKSGKPMAIHSEEGITVIMTPDGPALFETLEQLIEAVETGAIIPDPDKDE